MTKNDNGLVLKRTEKLSETKKAAMAQAGDVLKAAGFDYWTISAGNYVDDRTGREPRSITSNICMDLNFGACAALAILKAALRHLDTPKEQLAYLMTIVKQTLAEVNPSLAKEIEGRVNRQDQSDELEKMN